MHAVSHKKAPKSPLPVSPQFFPRSILSGNEKALDKNFLLHKKMNWQCMRRQPTLGTVKNIKAWKRAAEDGAKNEMKETGLNQITQEKKGSFLHCTPL